MCEMRILTEMRLKMRLSKVNIVQSEEIKIGYISFYTVFKERAKVYTRPYLRSFFGNIDVIL